MSRPIKFRAWGTNLSDGEKYIYDVIVIGNCAYENIDDALYGSYTTDKIENIEQYTGLKDKNGNEIYDGDIVQTRNWGRHDNSVLGESIVEYDNSYMRFVFNPQVVEDDYDAYRNIEIISNIHEESK